MIPFYSLELHCREFVEYVKRRAGYEISEGRTEMSVCQRNDDDVRFFLEISVRIKETPEEVH